MKSRESARNSHFFKVKTHPFHLFKTQIREFAFLVKTKNATIIYYNTLKAFYIAMVSKLKALCFVRIRIKNDVNSQVRSVSYTKLSDHGLTLLKDLDCKLKELVSSTENIRGLVRARALQKVISLSRVTSAVISSIIKPKGVRWTSRVEGKGFRVGLQFNGFLKYLTACSVDAKCLAKSTLMNSVKSIICQMERMASIVRLWIKGSVFYECGMACSLLIRGWLKNMSLYKSSMVVGVFRIKRLYEYDEILLKKAPNLLCDFIKTDLERK